LIRQIYKKKKTDFPNFYHLFFKKNQNFNHRAFGTGYFIYCYVLIIENVAIEKSVVNRNKPCRFQKPTRFEYKTKSFENTYLCYALKKILIKNKIKKRLISITEISRHILTLERKK
jgi:hypothetical protein